MKLNYKSIFILLTFSRVGIFSHITYWWFTHFSLQSSLSRTTINLWCEKKGKEISVWFHHFFIQKLIVCDDFSEWLIHQVNSSAFPEILLCGTLHTCRVVFNQFTLIELLFCIFKPSLCRSRLNQFYWFLCRKWKANFVLWIEVLIIMNILLWEDDECICNRSQ